MPRVRGCRGCGAAAVVVAVSFVVPAAVAAIQREAPSLRPRARRARAPAGIAPAPRAGPAARDPRGGAAG
ncbi:hypothetical protein, partial [Burkholderia plantarii]|uniref:hypothetical protein n=1 Tax=Burkholderia plantarii TaxID=41899 RepID=UPI001ABA752A